MWSTDSTPAELFETTNTGLLRSTVRLSTPNTLCFIRSDNYDFYKQDCPSPYSAGLAGAYNQVGWFKSSFTSVWGGLNRHAKGYSTSSFDTIESNFTNDTNMMDEEESGGDGYEGDWAYNADTDDRGCYGGCGREKIFY